MSTGHPGALSTGTRFHGRYEIVRCLKAGGMGAVYECVHLSTQKHRALKVMLPQVLATPGMRERFELEARVTAQIESEHIVETFDAGVDEATGAPFLVMELLRGDDLDSILRSRGPFPAPEAVVLLSQAALALDRTHAAGIVHRDLKPQNLFLTRRDDGSPRLKVLDFGIAKVVADGNKTAQQTAAIGTPVYMAPEQATGDGTIGPQADLYALGHISYALLTGAAYWTEEQQTLPIYALLSRMLAGASEPPTARAARRGVALPPAFDAWFARATARSRSDRFDRASTQITELATALGTAAPHLRLAPPLVPIGPPKDPPAISPRPSLPHSAQRAVAVISQPSTLPSSDLVPLGADPSSQLAPPERTTGPVANNPAPAHPVSRAPRVAVVIIGAVVAAAVLLGVVRVLRRPHPGETVAGAFASTAPAALAPASTVTPTPAPTVEPVHTVGATAQASSAAPSAPLKQPRPPPAAHLLKPTAAAKASSKCNPPFTLDAQGFKHAKPECL